MNFHSHVSLPEDILEWSGMSVSSKHETHWKKHDHFSNIMSNFINIRITYRPPSQTLGKNKHLMAWSLLVRTNSQQRHSIHMCCCFDPVKNMSTSFQEKQMHLEANHVQISSQWKNIVCSCVFFLHSHFCLLEDKFLTEYHVCHYCPSEKPTSIVLIRYKPLQTPKI